MDFANSGHAARLLLVEGMMSLLQTLRGRQLCIKDTCQSIASAGALAGVHMYICFRLEMDSFTVRFCWSNCLNPVSAPMPHV